MALVFSAKDGAASTNIATTAAEDTTGARFIAIVATWHGSASPTSVSDNKSNTWQSLTVRGAAASHKVQILYCINPTVGTGHTFTVEATSVPAIVVMGFDDFIGSFDAESGTNSGTQPGSITPADNSLFIAGMCLNADGDTPAINSSFTIAETEPHLTGQNVGASGAYKTSATAENPTWSGSGIGTEPLAMAAFTLTTVFGDYEVLDLTGLEIDTYIWRGERLKASFGSGYGAAAIVGPAHGLWGWTLSSPVLADSAAYNDDIDSMPSFEYYHDFIERHTTGSEEVFVIEFRGAFFHASFVDNGYGGEMLTYDLFSNTGVQLAMRKLSTGIYNADGSIDIT